MLAKRKIILLCLIQYKYSATDLLLRWVEAQSPHDKWNLGQVNASVHNPSVHCVDALTVERVRVHHQNVYLHRHATLYAFTASNMHIYTDMPHCMHSLQAICVFTQTCHIVCIHCRQYVYLHRHATLYAFTAGNMDFGEIYGHILFSDGFVSSG